MAEFDEAGKVRLSGRMRAIVRITSVVIPASLYWLTAWTILLVADFFFAVPALVWQGMFFTGLVTVGGYCAIALLLREGAFTGRFIFVAYWLSFAGTIVCAVLGFGHPMRLIVAGAFVAVFVVANLYAPIFLFFLVSLFVRRERTNP